jgi:phosphate:Na+ symporter
LAVPATVFRFLATATRRIARDVASAIEGLDAILLTLIDVAKEQSTEDAQFLEMMTSEEGHGISNVRSAYLAEESKLDPDARMKLLAAANYCERLIWLFGNMGRHYMALKV